MLHNTFSDLYTPIGIILIIGGFAFFAVGFFFFRQKRLIENIPTSKIRSLAMGLVEIYGDVVTAGETLLKSPLLKKDCVYYHYLVERYEQHYNSRTKKTEGHWVTVQNEKQNVRFYLRDDTGMVLVDPAQAKIEIKKDYQTGSGNMRYTEWYIEPHDMLYIMGTAGENPLMKEASASHVDNIMIQKGMFEKQYFISDRSEKDILKHLAIQLYIMWVVGIALLVGGVILSLRLI